MKWALRYISDKGKAVMIYDNMEMLLSELRQELKMVERLDLTKLKLQIEPVIEIQNQNI